MDNDRYLGAKTRQSLIDRVIYDLFFFGYAVFYSAEGGKNDENRSYFSRYLSTKLIEF